jgi:hypothetical protein
MDAMTPELREAEDSNPNESQRAGVLVAGVKSGTRFKQCARLNRMR